MNKHKIAKLLYTILQQVILFSGLDYRTGLTQFWYLHILCLDLLSLASKLTALAEDEQWNLQNCISPFIMSLLLIPYPVMLQAVQGM